MAFTTLDPRTALIVVDLQQGFTAVATVHPMRDGVRRAGRLADAFRRRDLTFVLVNVDATAPGRTEAPSCAPRERPAEWTEIAPELNRQPRDHLVTKRTWGSFTGTGLDAHFKAQGCTQVVVAGVATSAGIESTARQAHELGYNVTLASDAMTDMIAEAHDNSIARIFPRLGETGTTGEIVAMLDARGA